MWFELYETCVVNENAAKGLPSNVGDLCDVTGYREKSNYDYNIEFSNGETAFVRENELSKLTDEQKKLAEYIFFGNKVLHKSNELVKIVKVDYINHQAEVEFVSGGTDVVSFNSLKETEKESISVEKSPNLNNLLIDTFLSQYKNNDDSYTIPKIILEKLIGNMIEEVE